MYRINKSEFETIRELYSYLKKLVDNMRSGRIPYNKNFYYMYKEVSKFYFNIPSIGSYVSYKVLNRIRDYKDLKPYLLKSYDLK